MKYFTLHSLIPNCPINMILLPKVQLLRLTFKLVFLMEPILVYMWIVTKVIHIIHIVMKIFMVMNLNTTVKILINRLHNY